MHFGILCNSYSQHLELHACIFILYLSFQSKLRDFEDLPGEEDNTAKTDPCRVHKYELNIIACSLRFLSSFPFCSSWMPLGTLIYKETKARIQLSMTRKFVQHVVSHIIIFYI